MIPETCAEILHMWLKYGKLVDDLKYGKIVDDLFLSFAKLNELQQVFNTYFFN